MTVNGDSNNNDYYDHLKKGKKPPFKNIMPNSILENPIVPNNNNVRFSMPKEKM